MAQHVLVVGSDKQIASLLSPYLEEAGFVALAAYDVETAKEMLCAEQVDLVILDLGVRGHNDLEVMRWLRANPQISSIPILILTAQADETARITALEMGADDSLTRPLNPREVLARVRAILRRTQAKAGRPHILEVG